MYFDHVLCRACQTKLSPESIVTQQGTPSCPSCGAALDVTSFFGVGDAFVGVGDDEGLGMSLEDAIPGSPSPGGTTRPSVPRGDSSDRALQSALSILRDIRKNGS